MYKLTILDECDSTQEELKKTLKDNEFLAIIAKKQFKGKGSYSREWISDPGGLYLSFNFPTIPLNLPASIIFSVIVAISLQEYVDHTLGKHLGIIYPNDLVVKLNGNYYKLGGILVEICGNNYVIGIGINVNNQVSNYQFEHKALSLNELSRIVNNKTYKFDVVDIAKNILDKVSLFYSSRIDIYQRLLELDFTHELKNVKILVFMDGEEVIDTFDNIKIDYNLKKIVLYKSRMRKDLEFEKVRRIFY